MTAAAVPTNPPAKVLIVDDEALCRRTLARLLTQHGYVVSQASDAKRAIELLHTGETVDVVLTDLEMPNGSGLELVRLVHELDASIPCIVMTGYGSAEHSVDALRAGAFWYVEKPFDKGFASLHHLLAQAVDSRRDSPATRSARAGRGPAPGNPPTIIGRSKALEEVMRTVEKVATSDATVLITGESGTGKELVARAIFARSNRASAPFVPINCGAIPEELLESELFGHVKGAFTNADRPRLGRFQAANGGTIFLDEIGDMSPNLQVKLLRVLQDGVFEPVGSSTSVRVNVRAIAATNQNLEVAIREHRFREDLFYRLNVVPIHVPPLRERRGDVLILAQHFLEKFAHLRDKPVPALSPAALERLCEHDWPGNVRELENLAERVVVLMDRETIDLSDLPRPFYPVSNPGLPTAAPRVPESGLQFQQIVDQFASEIILQALDRTQWNKTQAAKLLGLNRTTLLEMIKKKGLDERSPTASS